MKNHSLIDASLLAPCRMNCGLALGSGFGIVMGLELVSMQKNRK